MKLSMWIVYDWLQEYHPEAHIREGRQTITGVRYMADDVDLRQEYLYIGYSDQYIDHLEANVICVNGTDLIVLAAQDIYVVFNEIQEMLEYYNSWETGIMQELNRPHELSFYLEQTVPLIRTGLAISDLSHKVMAHAGYRQKEEKILLEQGYLPLEEMRIVNAQMQKHVTDRKPYLVQSSETRDILFNLYSRTGKLTACMVSLGGGEGSHVQSRMQLMEVFGNMMNLWVMIHDEELAEQSLFYDVLEMKETDHTVMDLRLAGMGWANRPLMQLFVIRSCSSESLGIPFILRFLEHEFPGVSSVVYQEQTLLIVNYQLTERKQFLEEVGTLLDRQSCYCGGSYLFTDLYHLTQNYIQACLAAEYGSHTSGSINWCEDHAVEYIMEKLRDVIDTDICSPALEKLRKYDKDNGTDYYHTLYVYLLCERNQTLTAQKLFVHRNSLIYRIGRIESIIQMDLNEERERLYLLLSYLVQGNNNESGN